MVLIEALTGRFPGSEVAQKGPGKKGNLKSGFS
jgi:hypothetical protein